MDNKPKIAILHDAFLYRGGGERLVTLMAKSLGADLISGFFSEGSFDPRELGYEGKIIPLGKPVFMRGLRHMILKWRFFWNAQILREYDIVIFSGNCLDALIHVNDEAHKIYYCHTPPRYLFDFRDAYLSRIPGFIRPLFRSIFIRHAEKYKAFLHEFDTIFTNSKNVHNRLLQFCGYESEILYPPTDVHHFSPIRDERGNIRSSVPLNFGDQLAPFEEYFLSFSRLSSPKRVGVIVDAFLEMPEKNLVLTYGKNDPEKKEILRKIANAKNIIALESPSDDDLIDLIRGATASIYIPIDEDFGMAPVESMACGTPVIGAKEGGLRETIFEGKTGKFIEITDNEQAKNEIKRIVQETTQAEWKSMKLDSTLRATDFSLEKFENRIQSFLLSL